MEDKDIVQDLRDRLIVIETLIKNMASTNDLKLEKLEMKYEEKYKVQNHRISDLEEIQKENQKAIKGNINSLTVTVIGGIVLFLISQLYK